ncbi:tail fiber assembly protein [Salmonella enterica]|nr:phage tail protein [Salmonella enterica]EBN4455672.1 phage tail protein [Salmonella enterica]EEL6363023.1 tail fiber assembly protein [Salmonella enterica]EEN5912985.1 phage tail protein [Salmonella enterica]EIA2989284.1 tail fiber assembly protein [Salmonella enterica]
MDKYLFINNQFLPSVLKSEFQKNGAWDEAHGVYVSEDTFQEYTRPNDAQVLATGDDGYPVWADKPPLTHEEEIVKAEQKRQKLIANIDDITADWRVELMLGDISEKNKAKLSSWMAYKTEVKAVDISTAPEVTWPAQPEV